MSSARAALRRAPALLIGVVVVVLAAPALMLGHHAPRHALPRGQAISAALRDPGTRDAIRGAHWDRIAVGPVDGEVDRVSLFDGDRIVAEIAVTGDGRVKQGANFTRMRVPYGNWIAYEPGVLAGLAALFVLAAGVAPIRRRRNLDVVAALSLVVPVVLLQQRYVDASVVAALPGLTYLAVRCAWRGLGPAPPRQPATPLLNVLTPRLDARRRVRLLRLLLAALVLIFVMVGLSTTDAVDVVYAVMEGATKLAHGVLPYGHLPGDVIHGDTYPILSYAFYVPVATVEPVHSLWDSVDIALGVGVAVALASAWALFRSPAQARSSARAARPPELEEAGLRTALVWLSFPPLLITVSTGTNDVVLAAMLVAAILLWRRPGLSAAALAAAAWFKLAPVALLPVWLAALRGRRLAAAVVGIAGVSAAMVGLLLAIGGFSGIAAMARAISYQLSRGSPQSWWAALGTTALQPLAQACRLGFIAAAAVRLHRDPALADDRARLAALSASILIGTELVAQYWAFLYLVWVLPLLCLSLLESPEPARVRVPAPAGSEHRQVRPVFVR